MDSEPLAQQSAIEAVSKANTPRSTAGRGGTSIYRGKSKPKLNYIYRKNVSIQFTLEINNDLKGLYAEKSLASITLTPDIFHIPEIFCM